MWPRCGIKINDRASGGQNARGGDRSDAHRTRADNAAAYAPSGPSQHTSADLHSIAGLASFAHEGHHGSMRRVFPELALAASLAVPALAHGQAPAETLPISDPASASATTDRAPDFVEVATPQPAITPPTPDAAMPTASAAPVQPAPVASPPRAAPGSPPIDVSAEISPPRPRLQLAAGLVLGPHAVGEADCQSGEGFDECQHRGNFLGTGVTIELRAQLFRALYLHARGVVVGNVRQRPYAVHSGLAGAGIGLGAYSRLAFIRGEYMLIPAFGPSTYVPPFYNKQTSRDDYGIHAAMISGGLHKYVSPRTAIEGWAGVVVGPTSNRRTVSDQATEKRLLISFMINLGIAFDLVLAKGYSPPPRQPRQRRQW